MDRKVDIFGPGHMTKWWPCPYMVKNLKKSSFPDSLGILP